MDFQSAARFGERRVMVTDYDETAVEVNAKVVDEDTGEVICECESGGGESDFTITQITVTNNTPSGLGFNVASIYTEDDTSKTDTLTQIDPSNTYTVDAILYKGAANYLFTGAESEYNYILTGDIEPSPFGGIGGVIRGSGTITISSK